MVERVYNASALNVAMQDGADAGQSVPHVHAHIIPRRPGDMDSRGGNDVIYKMIESEDADLGRQLSERGGREPSSADGISSKRRGTFPPVVADDERKPRSDEEMEKEAKWLASEMDKEPK